MFEHGSFFSSYIARIDLVSNSNSFTICLYIPLIKTQLKFHGLKTVHCIQTQEPLTKHHQGKCKKGKSAVSRFPGTRWARSHNNARRVGAPVFSSRETPSCVAHHRRHPSPLLFSRSLFLSFSRHLLRAATAAFRDRAARRVASALPLCASSYPVVPLLHSRALRQVIHTCIFKYIAFGGRVFCKENKIEIWIQVWVRFYYLALFSLF